MAIIRYVALQASFIVSNFGKATEAYRKIYDVVSTIQQGKMNCINEITLTASSTTTVFEDVRLSAQTVITFDPKTANAATEKANGTIYVTTANRGSGSWTITHANNAQTDRTFQVSLIG